MREKKRFPIERETKVLCRNDNDDIWIIMHFKYLLPFKDSPFDCYYIDFKQISVFKGNEKYEGTDDIIKNSWNWNRLVKEGFYDAAQ